MSLILRLFLTCLNLYLFPFLISILPLEDIPRPKSMEYFMLFTQILCHIMAMDLIWNK